MLKFVCTLCFGAPLRQLLRVRYGQVFGDIHSFHTTRRAQAWACLSTGSRLTVVFLTFSMLVPGEGGVVYTCCAAPVAPFADIIPHQGVSACPLM